MLATASDAAVAREIRQAFTHYPALREESPQQARYHLLVLSNTTPRQWIAEQEAHFPRGICVITAPENFVRFVQWDGGSPERYAAFIERTVRDTILAR